MNQLRQMRESKGMLQADLAKAVGVSQGIISYWESGENVPGISNLIRLSRVFDISLEDMAKIFI